MSTEPPPAPVASPQVVVYQEGPSQTTLNYKAAIITGCIQIALSVASLAFGIACRLLDFVQGRVYIPIVGALGFYLVAGILGVIAGHSKGHNHCAIVACLVMSILAAVLAGLHVISGSISSDYHNREYNPSFYYSENNDKNAVNIVTTLIGGVELIVAIVSSVYMCKGARCCRRRCCRCCGGCCRCCRYSPNVNSAAYFIQQSGHFENQSQFVCGYAKMQEQNVGQPEVMGQPQFMGQPQQNTQYMSQAQGQLPAYSEHETKEVPQ